MMNKRDIQANFYALCPQMNTFATCIFTRTNAILPFTSRALIINATFIHDIDAITSTRSSNL